jgi:hypothetical protein
MFAISQDNQKTLIQFFHETGASHKIGRNVSKRNPRTLMNRRWCGSSTTISSAATTTSSSATSSAICCIDQSSTSTGCAPAAGSASASTAVLLASAATLCWSWSWNWCGIITHYFFYASCSIRIRGWYLPSTRKLVCISINTAINNSIIMESPKF